MAELNDQDAQDVKAYIETNGLDGIDEFLEKKLGAWEEVEIKMAITGDSGTGKSSFINAIRGIEDSDEDNAAPVDVIETTTSPACFPHPSNDKIKFWDLPGVGTPGYPTLEIYCSKVKLESYDTFLIFTASRFTVHDLELARKIRSLKKSFFLIRTKIDRDVRAESRKKSFNEEVMLNKIRDEYSKNLGDLIQNSHDMFLISNHDPPKWDFARLTQAILNVLPIRQQEALILSLTSSSSDFLRKKVEMLRGRIWKVAAVCAVKYAIKSYVTLAVGIHHDVDKYSPALLAVIEKQRSFYRSQLGLPEDPVTVLNLTAENQERLRRIYMTTSQECMQLIESYFGATEGFLRFIPILGPIAADRLFCAVYDFFQDCLTVMEKTAILVLDNIAAQRLSDLDLE